MSTAAKAVISVGTTGAVASVQMGPKATIVLCLLCVFSVLCVEAQRDNRRRSGRRKPTTESPPPVEELENESNPQKLDLDTESIAKPANIQPLEVETSAPPAASKDNSNSSSGGGSQFIVPRGTRKPRPMVSRSNGEARPKPTLPTFARKSHGRMPKPDRQNSNKKMDESGTSSTSTTTHKPMRNSSRRRSQTSEKSTPTSGKSSVSSEATTEAPKKRFGGGRRQSRGGSRRITTAAPEES